jgi:beta-fructofuranosidase
VTLGQKVVPEILSEYKSKSHVTYPSARTFNASAGIIPLEVQPAGSYYAVSGTFSLEGTTSDLPSVGFRVQSSAQEWTDVYFTPANETVTIDRSHSSLITTYGSDPEVGKLRLWNITLPTGSQRQDLNMSIFVDGSIIEVYANDVLAVTTRAYPWLSASTNVGFLVRNGTLGAASVNVSNVELWDGLLNAWPQRPNDTSATLVWDGPAMAEDYGGMWTGI